MKGARVYLSRLTFELTGTLRWAEFGLEFIAQTWTAAKCPVERPVRRRSLCAEHWTVVAQEYGFKMFEAPAPVTRMNRLTLLKRFTEANDVEVCHGLHS